MKKILQIVDTYDWAIGSLAKAIVKSNPHFDWHLMAIHPKDLEQGKVDLVPIIEAIKWADFIDAQYWRTLSQLLELIPELKTKSIFLWHHNEKNLLSYDWPENVRHVALTKYSEQTILEKYPNATVHYIPNSFNPELFKFSQEYPPKEKMVGYVGRIVPWKGLKEVVQACYELNYKLLLMGKMDKPSYFAEIPEEQRSVIDWSYFDCEDSDRPAFYKEITCYVGFSGGGRECGPLGLIEAMASGVPCITTPAGIAADIGEHEHNMMIVDYDDVEGLKDALKQVMESPVIQDKLRRNAWDAIKGFNDGRRSLIAREMYNSLIYKDELVSVIIPTTLEKEDQTHKLLSGLEQSSYRDFEAVVVFDQTRDVELLSKFREVSKALYSFPVKVLATGIEGGYNLAIARNLGAIEADGKYLLFCDNRMKPDSKAIEEFLKVLRSRKDEKVWVFGEKGGEKKTFVENFSMIRRQDFINAGMCNERVIAYGAMSQELRSRFARQGFEFGYVKNALAEQLCKSGLSLQKRDGIIQMKNLMHKLGL